MTMGMRIREIDWSSAEQRRTDNVLHLFTGIDLIRERFNLRFNLRFASRASEV